jgi:hypothetical protein
MNTGFCLTQAGIDRGIYYQTINIERVRTIIPDAQPTTDQFNSKDYIGSKSTGEFKSREYASTSFKTWWFDCHKIRELDNKEFYIFYYWVKDDALFYLKYDSSRFSEYSQSRYVACDGRETVNFVIPASDFTRIGKPGL